MKEPTVTPQGITGFNDNNPYKYHGVVDRVIDGDTFDVSLDLGFDLTFMIRLRINNFDAPETYRPRNEAEKAAGEAATARAKELVLGKKLLFITGKLPTIYGRYVATVILPDGTDYAKLMISEGFEKKASY